jgi:hypothetical protein
VPKTPLDLPSAVNEVRDLHRMIRFSIKQQSRLDRALGSLIAVREFGYVPVKRERGEGADASGKAVFTAVAKRIKAAIVDASDPLHAIVLASEEARKPFDVVRRKAELDMKKHVRAMPVWDGWAKGVCGLGELSVGHILGETGDLSLYPTVSKVWKRLGLAVIAGHRQGNPGRGASTDDWIEEGYNPSRRSEVFVMADTLFKAQTVALRSKGEQAAKYRVIYDARKAYEVPRVETLRHADNRARRYMSKCVIADLWSAWRETNRALNPTVALSPADFNLPDDVVARMAV